MLISLAQHPGESRSREVRSFGIMGWRVVQTGLWLYTQHTRDTTEGQLTLYLRCKQCYFLKVIVNMQGTPRISRTGGMSL